MYVLLFFILLMVVGTILSRIFPGDDDQTKFGDIGSV